MSKIKIEEPTIELPFGPPPVLPDVRKQLEEWLCPDCLPIHDYRCMQEILPRTPDVRSILGFDLSPLGTKLKVERDATTGKLLRFREVEVDSYGRTAKNSMAMDRIPAPDTNSVNGDVSNFPFWPGGFPEIKDGDLTNGSSVKIDFEKNLLTVAPGMQRGIEFMPDGFTVKKKEDKEFPSLKVPTKREPKALQESEIAATDSIMSVVQQEEQLIDLWKETNSEPAPDKLHIEKLRIDDEDENVLPDKNTIPVLYISKAKPLKSISKTEWAEMLDVQAPLTDFDQRIPDMAKKFPFELDNFQKQAILKLESQENVFVAAHTSAGKTVVAEYAIALSMKHMTNTVYTSPIKALSNQKYRDFKHQFQNVGLITGDIQINQQKSCLVMTTEILRSMLYQDNNMVKNLEFVIFDEVHYINDAERGYVWEEVLILLPDYVTIVMLSATVPNTLEFADWVGRTKKKKMYVINTVKRPVPLTHFLYTGMGSKSTNERFLILDEDGTFIQNGYLDAVNAVKSRKSGNTYRNFLNPQQEATLWRGLVHYLEKEEKLPVIAFTLSRKRCDINSESLTSVDLTTGKEKSAIHHFFQTVVKNLKEPDRELPQVKTMESLLKRGIGVHHSGILPILKEIVEMLFQRELVKLLFATETFAMGVNMPARTVIFDSVRKFDGNKPRSLLPAEYIQMAGRAGRRGLDKTGTVIILCKTGVPPEHELKEMMLGKPQKLTSQFKLTYSMILRLMRAEKMSVEDMISHSFMEFDKASKHEKYREDLQVVENEIKQMQSVTKEGGDFQTLSKFYDYALNYIQLWNDTRQQVLHESKMFKELFPGRFVIVSSGKHINKIGLVLLVLPEKTLKYKVLVLCDGEKPSEEISLELKDVKEEQSKKRPELWYKMIALLQRGKVYIPESLNHIVLDIKCEEIMEILPAVCNIKTDVVLNDWNDRQLPRFRTKPIGPMCQTAVQELRNLSYTVAHLQIVDPMTKVTSPTPELFFKRKQMRELERDMGSLSLYNIVNFEQQFEAVFERKQLEGKRENLNFLQSNQSMALYPDYEKKVRVLQKLKYIDSNKFVEFKGRVAIKMRNCELLITELVLQNFLRDLQPAEIASLLSPLIFQAKTERELNLTPNLKKNKEKLEEIEKVIINAEREEGIDSDLTKLNYGLMEVVYEWALEKPFAEIMKCTDVQEGIIVRCIQQLTEILKDVKDAANVIGERGLETKMDEALVSIKRDIVFAASLYTNDTKLPSFE